MRNYDFFQNTQCEFFPCHKVEDTTQFSCLFCYCPLYALGENCGGNFSYNSKGFKDCSKCLRPHCRENYDAILGQMRQILDMVKKPCDNP